MSGSIALSSYFRSSTEVLLGMFLKNRVKWRKLGCSFINRCERLLDTTYSETMFTIMRNTKVTPLRISRIGTLPANSSCFFMMVVRSCVLTTQNPKG